MAIRLYVEKVGPEESSQLEVKVNTETKMLKIDNEKVYIGNPSYISSPGYREGKYPTISMRYECGDQGMKRREETIASIKNIKCIKVREDQQLAVESSSDPEIIPFLDLIFAVMTKLSVANYDAG